MTDQTEQTNLVHNEEETFALEPIDITGNIVVVFLDPWNIIYGITSKSSAQCYQ